MKHIIRKILRESQEERLRGAYQKWCKKVKLNNKYQRDEITDIDGYIEELGRYSYDFEDPYSKTYKKTEELYSKGDYEGVHKLVVEYECGVELIDRKFKEWSSYRNQMPTSDIFQYKSENELYIELQKAKEKSFTKKLKKSKEGKDFEKIYEMIYDMEKEMKEFNEENNNEKKKKFTTSYALDQHWGKLQEKDKWYTFFPFLGKQEGSSSIMSQIENFINNVRFYNIQV